MQYAPVNIHRVALEVLDAASSARSLAEFVPATLRALELHDGWDHVRMITGASTEIATRDHTSHATGHARQMAGVYVRRHVSEWDPFGTPQSLEAFIKQPVVALGELPVSATERRRYEQDFLLPHGMGDQMVMCLDGGPAAIGFVACVIEKGSRFTDAQLATAQLLARPLGNLLRFHARSLASSALNVELSPREREVADLAATGYSNRQIGKTLFISEDTVKKHVSRILTATGYRSRTQLAVAWRVRADNEPSLILRGTTDSIP